jgi:hypothetical protein
MKKFFIMLVATMLLSVISVFAQGGQTGPLTWVLNNGTLTISGEGAMPDYQIFNYAPWYEYRESICIVDIKNGVTSIGNDAFWYCKTMTSVTIPNSVERIGLGAFDFCSSLLLITIPNSVTTIDESGAFAYCTSLASINVTPGNSNYVSEDGVLFDKNKTILICYPAGKTVISYIIPNSVTTIGHGSFAGCSCLTSVTIHDKVTKIGFLAFVMCTKLTLINIAPENSNYTSENGVLFDKNKTTLMCYPAGKTETSYVISNSVNSIEVDAFASNWYLISVVIPNSVATIKEGTFEGCINMASVTIGENVTSIEKMAFAACVGLNLIINHNPVPVVINSNVFLGVNQSQCALKVPINSVSAYKEAAVWKEFNFDETGIETIKSDVAKIYPNPTTRELTIVNGELTIDNYSIYNVMGQMVMEGKLQNETTTINVESLPNGMYFLRIGEKAVKLVKE